MYVYDSGMNVTKTALSSVFYQMRKSFIITITRVCPVKREQDINIKVYSD